jgi:hypothetical protein
MPVERRQKWSEDAGGETQLLPVLGEYLASCYNTAGIFAEGKWMADAWNTKFFGGKPGM